MVLDLSFVLVDKHWFSCSKIELNKIYMPDIINCDIWIETCMLGNN